MLLALVVVIVVVAALSIELSLARLIRIARAIHERLNEMIALQKAMMNQEPEPPPAAQPPPRPSLPHKSDPAAKQPEVYRVD